MVNFGLAESNCTKARLVFLNTFKGYRFWDMMLI